MPDPLIASWMVWALLSAAFAALTAIFAKVGVEHINSDLATFIRTVVILVVLAGILLVRSLWRRSPASPAKPIYFSHCPDWPRVHPGSAISAPFNSVRQPALRRSTS